MKDNLTRRTMKRVALGCFVVNVGVTRAVMRLRRENIYRLGGECRCCAKCCEAPGIQVGKLIWFLPTLRWLFLWWQRVVNGFELKERDISNRVFVFNCTHFDRETRRCDSYGSRPGMCRDYPRALLHTANPDFFPECGFRAVNRRARQFVDALEQEDLPEEKIEEIKKRLHLRE